MCVGGSVAFMRPRGLVNCERCAEVNALRAKRADKGERTERQLVHTFSYGVQAGG